MSKPLNAGENQGDGVHQENTIYTYVNGGVECTTPSSSLAFARMDVGSSVFVTHLS
jgi:hypothetical protein